MRIAVLDDDPSQVDFVCQTLDAEGHKCHRFWKGESLRKTLRRETFDLLIIDWVVPDLSGEELLLWIRKTHHDRNLPVIFMAARSDEKGIARILNAGADDYLVKPFSARILCARVSSLFRRVYPSASKEVVVKYGGYTFDVKLRQVYCGEHPVKLTPKEYALAIFLFQHVDLPLSRAHILELVWGMDDKISSRTIDTHMTMVRAKLNLNSNNGYKISPIYGYGYRMEFVGPEKFS